MNKSDFMDTQNLISVAVDSVADDLDGCDI